MQSVASFLLLDKSRRRLKKVLKNSGNAPEIQLYRAIYDEKMLTFNVELVEEPGVAADGMNSGSEGGTVGKIKYEQQGDEEYEELKVEGEEEDEDKDEDEEEEEGFDDEQEEEEEGFDGELKEDEQKKEIDNDLLADENLYYGTILTRLPTDLAIFSGAFLVFIPGHGLSLGELVDISLFKKSGESYYMVNAPGMNDSEKIESPLVSMLRG